MTSAASRCIVGERYAVVARRFRAMSTATTARMTRASKSQTTVRSAGLVDVCEFVDGRELVAVAGVLVAAGAVVTTGAGVTVKSVRRFAVVCELAIVPSRQTCEPIVAPGAMTWLKGPGLLVLDPGLIPPDEVA